MDVLVFNLGVERYAMPISAIREILETPEITRTPLLWALRQRHARPARGDQASRGPGRPVRRCRFHSGAP